MTPTPKSYINAQLNLNKTVIIISDMPKHKIKSSLRNLRSKKHDNAFTGPIYGLYYLSDAYYNGYWPAELTEMSKSRLKVFCNSENIM